MGFTLFLTLTSCYSGRCHLQPSPEMRRSPEALVDIQDDLSYSSDKLSQDFCSRPRQRFMFSKNRKVGGSTLGGIFTQIATHYHQYEIVRPKRDLVEGVKFTRQDPGYITDMSDLF